jgi:hypothetical protein
MKKNISILIGSFVLLLSANLLKAQNCSLYMPLAAGTEYQYQMYDSGNKPDGTVNQKINTVTTSADGMTIATITSTSKDKKDKEVSTATVNIKCDGKNIYFDLQSLISAESKKQWEGMEMKVDGQYMEIPQTLTEGMTLKDGVMTINVYDKGTLFSTMKFTIYNRKVAGTETVATPTGTYTTLKVTSDIKMETIVMNMSIPMNTKSAEYYAAGVGVVKSEAFNKAGKLLSYQLLSKIIK